MASPRSRATGSSLFRRLRHGPPAVRPPRGRKDAEGHTLPPLPSLRRELTYAPIEERIPRRDPEECCEPQDGAEGVGFEPTEGCPSHAFQACRFGRSRIPPE